MWRNSHGPEIWESKNRIEKNSNKNRNGLVHGVTKSQAQLSNWTELNWTELNWTDHIINLSAKMLLMILSEIKNFQRAVWRSVQFSHSVVSDCLQPHGLQHTRLPCPTPSPGVYSNSLPSSRWCHPTISSSVIPFSSCLQSFPTSGSFPMSQFFTSGGQSIGVSASASVLPSGLIFHRMDWLDLLAVQGTLKSLLQHHSSKASFFSVQLSL